MDLNFLSHLLQKLFSNFQCFLLQNCTMWHFVVAHSSGTLTKIMVEANVSITFKIGITDRTLKLNWRLKEWHFPFFISRQIQGKIRRSRSFINKRRPPKLYSSMKIIFRNTQFDFWCLEITLSKQNKIVFRPLLIIQSSNTR